MSKPYMCGDEIEVYIPSGGCDCDYTLLEIESTENRHEYELLLNGSKVGDTIIVPKDQYIDTVTLKAVEYPEVPYAGAIVGDYYLDFTYKENPTHIYVPLAEISGGGYLVVDELPDVGNPRYIYLVDDGQGNYDRFIWSEGEWVDIGGTEIDLSNYYTKSEIDGMLQNIMLRIYPIGSVYISTTSTDPTTLFGGTWERIEDRFLLAAGNTYSAGGTGGAASVTLTENQLPKISGTFEIRRWGSSQTTGQMIHQTSGKFTYTNNGTSENMAASTTYKAQSQRVTYAFGGGSSHTNMPPYLTVYVWKRTA